MTPARWNAISAHLDHALDLSPAERDGWVASLVGETPSLAADVRSLLAEHEAIRDDSFLDRPLADRPDVSTAGHRIGAYTLTSLIGRGGMGTVWRARRSDGRFDSTVAIKLLNLARLDRVGEARFTREGQVLARLRHANIARLLDAGVSALAQPYLVLEYVEGAHIDEYCDARNLDTRARVRLFLDVLAAVAHAHANLIVHRDIKPSNVLVTAAGEVKLVDFGIAKLLDAEAGVAGMTVDGAPVLTPSYAAPEQITGGAVTTATDVYALGLLLSGLLGAPPQPVGDTPAEWLAMVEKDRPRLSEATANHSLRGDLENIVAKALKRAPEERYASVSAMAEDLARYLRHEPVTARRDTFAYRTAKFLRRRRRAVALAAAVALTITAIVGFYTARLESERDRARLEASKSARVTELMTGLLTGADPYPSRDREPTVRNILDAGAERVTRELRDQPAAQAEMLTVMGRVYQRLGAYDRAAPLLERAVALERAAGDTPAVAQTLNDLGVLRREQGDVAAATPLLEQALAIRRQRLGAEHKDVAVTLVELGRAYEDSGRPERAEPLFREALAIREHLFGGAHRETSTSQSALGLLLWRRGELDAAETLLRQSLDTSLAVLPAEHPNVASGLNNLGLILLDKGDPAGAEPMFRQSLAIKRRVFGNRHPSLAPTLNNLAGALRQQGQYDQARSLLDEALRLTRAQLGDQHQSIAGYEVHLATVDLAQGRAADAERLLRDALGRQERTARDDDWRLAATRSALAEALIRRGAYAEASPLLVAASGVLKDVPGRQGREAAATRDRLAVVSAALTRRQR